MPRKAQGWVLVNSDFKIPYPGKKKNNIEPWLRGSVAQNKSII